MEMNASNNKQNQIRKKNRQMQADPYLDITEDQKNESKESYFNLKPSLQGKKNKANSETLDVRKDYAKKEIPNYKKES